MTRASHPLPSPFPKFLPFLQSLSALLVAGCMIAPTSHAGTLSIPETEAAIEKMAFMEAIPVDSAVLDSFTQEDFRNFKVVGRGIRDRETGEVLKLACVGARLRESGEERKCDVLNFVHSDHSGAHRLIGDSFTLVDGTRMKDQLIQQMRRRGLKDETMAHSRVMEHTRDLVSNKKGVSRTLVGSLTGLSLISGIAFLPAAGIGLGTILIMDLAILPFALVQDHEANTPALKADNISALQDRTKAYWQVTPQSVSSRRFKRIHSLLAGENVNEELIHLLE